MRIHLVAIASIIYGSGIACRGIGEERIQDVIYLKQGGCAFTLDVFKPKVSNHKGIVYMVSGGWFSSHASIDPGLAKVFTDRGFTLFEVVHGSQPKYTISEIVPQVRRAVRFIRANASGYGIDPLAIGVVGGSAGGHLTLEIAGLGDDGNPTSNDPVERVSSRANAAVAFYPPTDFLNWGIPGATPIKDPKMVVFLPAFGVPPQASDEVVKKIGRDLSPIYLINPSFPPTLLVHGDADELVPVQQSKSMDLALENAKITHKLVIVPGGKHGGSSFGPAIPQMLSWFDDHLSVATH